MKSCVIFTVVVGLTAAACAGRERQAGAAGLTAPRFSQVQDLDGTADLVVDVKRLAESWVVYDQDLKDGFCSLQEGGVPPGVHRVLRFTVTTPNVGTADLFIGDPLDHVAANDGLFEFASCHHHFHFRNYATYELISRETGQVYRSAKRGFCMIDVTPWRSTAPPKAWVYDRCGTLDISGYQGISVGYADTYDKRLGGQYFVLDGPTDAVPPGEYAIRITVNPPFACGPEDTARPRDAQGLCHMFPEGDYDNNVGEVAIIIPDRAGKTGFGPGAGSPPPGTEPADDEQRRGAL